jgi:hypothetical protein
LYIHVFFTVDLLISRIDREVDMNDRSFIVGLSVFVMLSCGVPHSFAQDGGDGMAIEWMSSIIDNEARKLGGTKVVAEHFKAQYGVNTDVIYALREQKIGYGDIGVVLAMAEQMPGGINRHNLDEIVSLHAGQNISRRWETIADYLGLDSERFIHRVNAVTFQVPDMDSGNSRQLSSSR